MSLPYERLLLDAMKKVLDAQQGVNWFLNTELSDLVPKGKGLSFSFFDNGRTFDLPFEKHPGYLNIESSKEKVFRKVFLELTRQYLGDVTALSNIYIIIQGISAADNFLDDLLKDYKRVVAQTCANVFDQLCTSLNSKYFSHFDLQKIIPENIRNWIDIFHSAQSFHPISDPVINILKLVRDERNRMIAFKWLLKMKPMLRAPLIGWYGFHLDDTEGDIRNVIFTNKQEASFAAATIIEDIENGTTVPSWLIEEIIEIFINKYWEEIGKVLLVHAFGVNYRNGKASPLLSYVEKMLSSVLNKSLTYEVSKNNLWNNKWEFPDTFVAFCNWLSITKRTSISELPEHNRRIILQKMISALQLFIDDIPKNLSDNNYRGTFNTYHLLDEKFLNALGFLLLYLLEEPGETQKRLKSMFFKVRPLFFGAYEASHMAEKFTEFMMVMALSIVNLHDLDDSMIAKWEKLLKSLCDTLLVPYLHLAERNSLIWDKGKKLESEAHYAGLYLINKRIGDILDGPYSIYLNEFLLFFNSVKVAEWPFERRIHQKLVIKIDQPKGFSTAEKEIIVSLLVKQNKVRNPSLKKLNDCLFLGAIYINEEMVSIGAIKPKTAYDFDEKHANLPEQSLAFKWELGYCFTEDQHTRRGYSRMIVDGLLSNCPNENILATTVISEENSMARILERFGFNKQGSIWNSIKEPENKLALFLLYRINREEGT